jgi:hypothetical protein
VVLSDDTTSIGIDALRYCDRLESITMPKVETIGNYAFQANSLALNVLTVINMPEVTAIGDGAFGNRSNLVRVSMPKVESIVFSGTTALSFYQCSKISEVVIAGVNTHFTTDSTKKMLIQIDQGDFSKTLVAYPAASGNVNVDGNGITKIGTPGASVYATIGVFQDNINITGFTASGITAISWAPFSGCKNLSTVSIGGTFDTVPDNFFYDCANL